jgi:hypothetical protein
MPFCKQKHVAPELQRVVLSIQDEVCNISWELASLVAQSFVMGIYHTSAYK